MKNNPILEANLNQIARYNPDLKYKILRINSLTHDIRLSNTALQEPNLTYDGEPLHSLIGAENEAKTIFFKIQNSPVNVYVVFGFGLGYLFQQFALNSDGLVLVYEPNLEIIASTLEVADLSNELSKGNVFVFSDFNDLKNAYREKRIPNSETIISFLPSYKKLFSEELNIFAKKLQAEMGISILNDNYIKGMLKPALNMVCENIDYLLKETPLLEFKDVYKGKTALIISAGPSLDKNLEVVKKYKDNVVIFAVSQAVRSLVKNGITPDFVVSIEQNDSSPQIRDVDVSNSYLITEPLTHTSMHKANFKKVLSYPSITSVANLVWSRFANINSSEYISSGTVSYTALYSAMLLGCDRLILVGQDLAYCGGKCYSNGTNRALIYKENPETGKVEVTVQEGEEDKILDAIYKNLSIPREEKLKKLANYLARINSSLNYVDGIKGNKLPTSSDYASFIIQFGEFAHKFGSKLKLYNTSLEGAKISGFEDTPLETLLNNSTKIEKLDFTKSYSFDLKSIKTLMDIEIKTLMSIQKLVQSAQKLVKSYETELSNRNNMITEQAGKYFKQLLLLYSDLSEGYSAKSVLFKYLNIASNRDLTYKLKLYKNVDEQAIRDVSKSLKQYFAVIEKDVEKSIAVLSVKVLKINEMLDSTC